MPEETGRRMSKECGDTTAKEMLRTRAFSSVLMGMFNFDLIMINI